MPTITSFDKITHVIYSVRGIQVILDSDLAILYDVPTKRLNEQVKRNQDRFPEDFMFQLTEDEWESLRSQIATSSLNKEGSVPGGRRYLPYVFTEHGIAMLSSVLRSQRAIQVNISIIRVFVKLRHWAINHSELRDEIKKPNPDYALEIRSEC